MEVADQKPIFFASEEVVDILVEKDKKEMKTEVRWQKLDIGILGYWILIK